MSALPVFYRFCCPTASRGLSARLTQGDEMVLNGTYLDEVEGHVAWVEQTALVGQHARQGHERENIANEASVTGVGERIAQLPDRFGEDLLPAPPPRS